MKTHIVIVLDKSGSMQKQKDRTLSDYNEQVQMCQDINATGEQEVICYFVSFNHDVTEHLWGKSANELQVATNEQYVCSGGTALYDTQGYVYSKLLETVIPNLEEKDAILIQILTDGEELSSKKFSAGTVSELNDQLIATKKVTVTLMGASKKSVESVAHNTGIPIANCAFYEATAKGVDAAYQKRSSRTRKYMSSRSLGVSCSTNYMSDKESVADFTKDELDVDVAKDNDVTGDKASKVLPFNFPKIK
jgi:hypothetical protein